MGSVTATISAEGAEMPADAALSDDAVLAGLDRIEVQRRALAAEEAHLLAEAEGRKLYRAGDHASMYGLLRSRLGWSDGECRSRMRVARGSAVCPDLAVALGDGMLPLAHAEVLATAVSTPTFRERVEFRSDIGFLLNEGGLEYDQFRKLVQRAEAICDPQRSNTTARDRRERRTATVSVDDAGATLEASLDALDGAEVLEIFANFVDAEFRADWDDAVARLGDDVTPSHLARTDRQRQADALVTIFRTAAGAPAESDASCEPTVTILLDERTFRDTLTEFGVLPRRDRDPFDDPGLFWSQRRCETTTGVVIDPRTAT
jgi:hypothetical protein